MEALANIIRRESTLTLLREAVWRTQKRWKRMRFQAEIKHAGCPVRYRPSGYYQPRPEQTPEAAQKAILKFSDLLRDGKFCWFGYGPVALGNPPRWNFDFVSGCEWTLAAAKSIPVMRHDGSDVKVPWELSRLQFLPVLGKAWLLSRQTRYRDLAKNLTDDWIEHNPVGWGINWTIAMEAALRGMSLCFLLQLLAPFSPSEQDWLQRTTKSLWEHLLFIEAHNELSHFRRSNHYLSNIIGLLHLSSSLTGPGMAARREKYRRLVESEMLCQVRDDGMDYEASTGYHLLVTQMFTSAWLVLRSEQRQMSPGFGDRLSRMYHVLHCLGDGQCRIPQVGDCDDGRVELLTDDLEQMTDDSWRERDSLRAGSWAGIGQALFKEEFSGRSDDIGWYGLDAGRDGTAVLACRPPIEIYSTSGIAVGCKGTAKLFFFAMPNGIFGKGSHTHNDKLSIVLKVAEHELFSDTGTFCYSRDAVLRNSFRSTLAHNTVQIGGAEQNRYATDPDHLFRMFDDARVSAIEWQETDSTIRFSASHEGYSRLGVIHRRNVVLGLGELTMEDVIAGSGQHLFDAAWHLPATWHVQVLRGNGLELECFIGGPRTVKMNFSSVCAMHLECLPAMISRAYGATSEGTRIQIRANPVLPFVLLTRISWEER